MKSTSYARLALFLPYLFLFGAQAYLRFPDSERVAGITLDNLSFVWSYLALFWMVPYSISVLCLLLWSRGKSLQKIINAYSLAPFVLVIVTLITYTIVLAGVWLYTGQMWEGLDIFAATSAVSILADLVVGYLFVGIALLLFIVLKKIGFIKEEQALESAVQPSPPS